MAKKKTILVAAPRLEPWDAFDKSSRIVLLHYGRLHPENEAYKMPAGEICICQGQGVKGDPGGQETPWEVYPYKAINDAIREGKLEQVREHEDTSRLQLDADDLRTLTITAMALKGLQERRIEGVSDLTDKLSRADDPVAWLTSIKGIGEPTAHDLLEQLEARGE